MTYPSIKSRLSLFLDALDCARRQANDEIISDEIAKVLVPIREGSTGQITSLQVMLDPADSALS